MTGPLRGKEGRTIDVGDDFVPGEVEAVRVAVAGELEIEVIALLAIEEAHDGINGLALVGKIFELEGYGAG